MLHIEEETELAVFTSGGTGGPRLILVGSALIPEKATRDTAGINMVTLKKNARIAKSAPGGGAGTERPAPLPRAHPARSRRAAPPGGHDRADESVRSKKAMQSFFCTRQGKVLAFCFLVCYIITCMRVRAGRNIRFGCGLKKELLLIHDRL